MMAWSINNNEFDSPLLFSILFKKKKRKKLGSVWNKYVCKSVRGRDSMYLSVLKEIILVWTYTWRPGLDERGDAFDFVCEL